MSRSLDIEADHMEYNLRVNRLNIVLDGFQHFRARNSSRFLRIRGMGGALIFLISLLSAILVMAVHCVFLFVLVDNWPNLKQVPHLSIWVACNVLILLILALFRGGFIIPAAAWLYIAARCAFSLEVVRGVPENTFLGYLVVSAFIGFMLIYIEAWMHARYPTEDHVITSSVSYHPEMLSAKKVKKLSDINTGEE